MLRNDTDKRYLNQNSLVCKTFSLYTVWYQFKNKRLQIYKTDLDPETSKRRPTLRSNEPAVK